MSRIVFVGTKSERVIRLQSGLINRFSESGYDVFVLAIDYNEENRNKIREIGAKPISYSLSRSGLNPFVDIVNMLCLLLKIEKINPDIVFSTLSKPVIWGTLSAKLARTHRICGMLEGLGSAFTVPPDGKISLKIRIARFIQLQLYRISFPMLDQLILLNHDDRYDLVEKFNLNVKHFAVIPGVGVDLRHYSVCTPNVQPVTFLFVGRCLAEKGIWDFIAAAEKIKAEFTDTEFLVLGGVDPDNPGSLAQKDLDELIARGIVKNPGHVEDIRPFLAKSSVFVLPSYYREGFPRSTMEAMASGLPVITTDSPGCRESIQDGVNGYLVKPAEPNDLVRKMRLFVKDRSLIATMGIKSREIAEELYDVRTADRAIFNLLVGL